jgi:hypothetical protein
VGISTNSSLQQLDQYIKAGVRGQGAVDSRGVLFRRRPRSRPCEINTKEARAFREGAEEWVIEINSLKAGNLSGQSRECDRPSLLAQGVSIVERAQSAGFPSI